eukprot:TRINITY_DN104_c0_g1_i2.p2 TRINITY_DN104_c0_g1~~TRINITY_DN104_c0_g1_i2.p2  ORF type:complete len:795 (-),score=227.75 TRINITY_DN104_c0_g1_i2:2571-4841(-)
MAGIHSELQSVMQTTQAPTITSRKSLKAEAMEEEEHEEEQKELDWLEREKKRTRAKELEKIDHKAQHYEPFRKNFYTEASVVSAWTPEEVATIREENEGIQVKGKNCPKPVLEFIQVGLRDRIMAVLKKYNFERPTPIQMQAMPAIMSGRDVIGCAKTGSGKTLAFLLPLFRHVMDQRRVREHEGPIALVLAPTRELAVQIFNEARKFATALELRISCIYGGAPMKDQIAELKRGAEVVVCTPGRMIDMLCANAGKVTNLKRVTYVVLDEADRMFDMGFEPQIMKMLENVRTERQTVMFSATFPRQVEALARKVLRAPIEIIVGGRSRVTNKVDQHVEIWKEDQKMLRLLELLGVWNERGRILIFVDRQDAADMLFRELLRNHYMALTLHGGKDQSDREGTIADFKNGACNILIATSVAARGLDVKDLMLVVNWSCPNHLEDYVHRVGRTGRAGREGTSYTFITPDEESLATDIVTALKNSNATVPPEIQALADSAASKQQTGELTHITGSGYGGKGYQFNEDEALAQDALRRQERAAYGVEEPAPPSDDEVDADAEDNLVTDAPAIAPEVAKDALLKLGLTPEQAAAMAAARAAAQKVAIGEFAGAAGAAALGDNASAQDIREAALRYAQTLQPTTVNIVPGGKVGGLTPIVEITHFSEEVEINDYPQHARWVVTQKESLAAIAEWTGVAITTRGSYVQPGRNAPPGERKLFLLVEGRTSVAVAQAKREIKRVLEEAAVNSQDKDNALYGKYKVV